MNSLEYRNKRDQDGLLLKNSAYSLTSDFVDECFEAISKYKVYEGLVSSFDKQYIESYFKKLFFYDFLPIAHQLTIKQWDEENAQNDEVTTIDASSFSCIELIENSRLIKNDNLIFDYGTSITFAQKAKQKCKPLVKKIFLFLKRISLFNSLNYQNVLSIESIDDLKIAVAFSEDLDLTKRSEICWLADPNIDPSSVLIYFKNNESQKNKSIRAKLKENNLQWIDLNLLSLPTKFHLGNNIIDSIKNTKSDNKIHKWVLRESKKLIYEINYWYSFFQYFDIKVHSNQAEYGLDTIVQQIALEKFGGVSFLMQRSYLDSLKGKFYGYYPTDIFFTWGRDSAEKLKKNILNNNFNINSILISGCQNFITVSKEKSVSLEKIKKNFLTNGAKTTIMFLDSNHDLNNNWQRQSIDTNILEKIYISLLKMVIDNKEIALIIKYKKKIIFESLYNIVPYLNDADKTGRLFISETTAENPSSYVNISDLIVGITSEALPASVIECAVSKKPSIIYDYAGLSTVEKKFYSWGYQKVIFDNVESMMNEIKLFSNNGNKYNDFGKWDDHLADFDSFQDHISYLRIGFYLQLIIKLFNSGIEKKALLEMANEAYSKKYGKEFVGDSIFQSSQ